MPSPSEYRALAEDASASAVAGGSSKASTFVKVLVPLGAVAIAGWMVWSATRSPTRPSLTASDTEEFRTTQFPAPALSTPRPQINHDVITIPPAPLAPPPAPPQPPTTIEAPPPIPAPLSPPIPAAVAPDDSEARRLAEEERRRREEEERRRWERLRAGQLIGDTVAAAGQNGVLAAAGNGTGSLAGGEEDDPNRRFMARASQSGADVSQATRNRRVDALVAQGTLIKGVLETAIQSDLAGMVRAVVSEDVWSFDGRRVLIPAGSRLVGEYRSGLTTGQTRVFIVWTRLLRSDGVSVQLGSPGTDELGRAGMTGIVDKHYLERFGSAVMLSIVGGATQFIANLGTSQNQGAGSTTTYTDLVTGQVVTVTSQPNQYAMQARQIGAQQISQTLNRIAEEALRDSLQIRPTVHVDQGSRIMVFVRRDLDFAAFYPDPVREALQEIRRERAANRLPR